MTFSYLEASVAFLSSLIAVVIAGPSTIEFLRHLKMRQPVGVDAPQPVAHQTKHGTPTMGGVLFVVGALVSITVGFCKGWLLPDADAAKVAVVFGVLLLHMGLGFLDDYLKAVRGKAMGLKARHKLVGQFIIALIFVVYLAVTSVQGVTTVVAIAPDYVLDISPWIYYPLVIWFMMGLSNSVNLTDGLDGLASGLSVLAFIGLALTTFGASPDVSYFGWAMAGGCLGFLVFNGFPASVFMGDTGSLGIGASLAAMAVLGKQEAPALIFCLLFILETVSVVIQVVSFKTRGKRVFKMAPVHYHFELLGWREVQIVQRFWILGVITLWLGLITAFAISPFLSVGPGSAR
jgi:phospho-N-acetylmuramoyl-pentapeptide-transferase